MKYGYLLSYYVSSLVARKRPLLAGIKLTYACNLKCVHCPFRCRQGGPLSFSQATTAMERLRGMGVKILIIEGGEPFLWKDDELGLADIVRAAKRMFPLVGVTTNGTFPLEVECDIVWVSVDGMKTTHDRIRGESFERILANIETSSHQRIYAHVTVNSLNWSEVAALVKFLASRVEGITFQFHYPYAEVSEDLVLPFNLRAKVLDGLLRLKRDGLPVADSSACLQALKGNQWRCRPWMIANVDPDGRITHGCYVKGRGDVSCERCGFSAHAEISLAYGGSVGAMRAGHRIFFNQRRSNACA
jgi:MoaA/NifB/PqqE/SkfB family radical SAM enzyme